MIIGSFHAVFYDTVQGVPSRFQAANVNAWRNEFDFLSFQIMMFHDHIKPERKINTP